MVNNDSSTMKPTVCKGEDERGYSLGWVNMGWVGMEWWLVGDELVRAMVNNDSSTMKPTVCK